MNCRKQGRRSAKTADETKHLILMTACEMFCDLGFEKVSLRNISEAAGVSHSLIRHHFGSKEQIWYTVSDTLNAYMQSYIHALVDTLPTGQPANLVLYRFAMKLMAHMLAVPQPMQFIADAIRQEGKFFDYFMDGTGELKAVTQELVNLHNKQNPNHPIDLWELKWQIMYSAHAAISLGPLIDVVWENDVTTHEQAVFKHWQLFNKKMVKDLNISSLNHISPANLNELLLPIAGNFSYSNPNFDGDTFQAYS